MLPPSSRRLNCVHVGTVVITEKKIVQLYARLQVMLSIRSMGRGGKHIEIELSCKVQFSTYDSACSQNPEDCSLVTCIVKVKKIIMLLLVVNRDGS